ncbi:MAG TPA: type II toxin-antitoxin system VapC family toxin [Sphingomicrobium sp.]|nr:type II toxin-antitoxin system VapC family toxin [Sphingomicrobium sp.]
MAEIVLDASAILAFLQREKGADIVEGLLPDAAVSANNLAEVIAKLVDHGVPIDDIEQIIAAFDFSIVDVSKDDAVANGLLRAATRKAGLSLGDRSCIALAQRLALPVLTTDRAWGQLPGITVEVRLLR